MRCSCVTSALTANPWWLWLLLCLGLSGCADNSLKQAFEDYRSRLANVLHVAPANAAQPAPLRYPALRGMKQNIPELNINLRDFYALNQCEVNSLIAERNTALGKIQAPSQRYVYERKLLSGLRDCREALSDTALAPQLDSWIAQKALNLDRVWIDLIQTSDELRRFFSRSDRYMADLDTQQNQQALSAFSYLLEIQRKPESELARIEDNLRILSEVPLFAVMHRSARLIGDELALLTAWLEQRKIDSWCQHSVKRKQITYLQNVFKLFFIQKIQAQAAALTDQHYKLSPLLKQLLQQPSLSPVFVDVITEYQRDYQRYMESLKSHVTYWQRTFHACEVDPVLG